MHRDVMDAVAHLCRRIGNVLRAQTLIDRFPCCAAVISAKRTRSGDGNNNALAIARIQQNRVQAHAAGAWLPLRSRAMTAQTRQFVPGHTAVTRPKQRGIFNARIDAVRIVERRFEMPDSFELPWVWSAVIPLMRCQRLPGFFRSVVNKLIALT